MNSKEIQAKLDIVQATLDNVQQQVDDRNNKQLEAIAGLESTVQSLKDQIANGGTAEDLQPISDQLDGILTDLKGTIQTPPVEPPVIEPPVVEPPVVEPPVIEPPVTPEEPA